MKWRVVKLVFWAVGREGLHINGTGLLVMGVSEEGLLWERILANRDGIRATQKLG